MEFAHVAMPVGIGGVSRNGNEKDTSRAPTNCGVAEVMFRINPRIERRAALFVHRRSARDFD